MRETGKRFISFACRHWPTSAVVVILLVAIMTPHRLERFFVYYPMKEVAGTPSDLGLAYQDVFPVTDDHVRLHGWFLPFSNAAKTLLIFHGNAGNIGHRLPWLKQLHDTGANVLIIDYRGFGRSEGAPFEKGLYKDARAAYAWWQQRPESKEEKLILVGESLGGAVAIELAAHLPVAGLILQSTFTSAWDMAKTIMPLGLLQPLTGVRFDSADRITQITCPKLIIHGDRDNIVPFRLGKKLFDLAQKPKEFYEVPGASHNDLLWVAGPEYDARVRSFLTRLGP